MITVCYCTSRLDPKIQWFFDSFHREVGAKYDGVRVVVVDFYRNDESRLGAEWTQGKDRIFLSGGHVDHVAPMPSVWQGPHRLTKIDYFDEATARNTALCLAQNGWIVYLDDLSVLMPGWWAAVKEATTRPDYITCGAYSKKFEMVVENGKVISCRDNPIGNDLRLNGLNPQIPNPCHPGWLYGCCVVGQVEAFLSVNGWPMDTGSMGYGDAITGIVLANRGWKFLYDPRIMEWESEEGHHTNKPFVRIDKGVSPNDRSHWLLRTWAKAKQFDNYFPEGGIRKERERVLRGEPFTVIRTPENDPFDGQLLSEM